MRAKRVLGICFLIFPAGIVALASLSLPLQGEPLPPASTCVSGSLHTWKNNSFATQAAQFIASYDATPSQNDMDGVIGFSLNAATRYTSLAAITRFNPNGMIDVRNGGSYAADVSLPYAAGQSYHFRLIINPATQHYSVYVTPPGSSEIALASNYAFRSEQASTSSLNNWAIYSEVGTQSVCNMTIAVLAISHRTPATITTQPANQSVLVGQTASFGVVAAGTTPLSYQWKKNGTAISGATSATYTTPATTTSDSGSQFTVTVSNLLGSVTSATAVLSVSTGTCLSGVLHTWENASFATQVAQFTASYDATPSQTDIDGVIGFSLNSATGYTSLAAITRFNPSGMIDVRNGGGYAADVSLPYAAGQSYHFRLIVNPATQHYSVYVTPPGSSEIALASNYAFRSEQASTSSLNNWAIYSEVGTQSVCNMIIVPSTNAPATLSLSTSSLNFGSVAVGTSKTLSATVTNSGSTSATIASVTISGPGFSAGGISTGQIISAGQQATLNGSFAPAATGSVTGSVTIASNASNSLATISLSGTGVVVSHSATLSWTASTSVVIGYYVYRSTASAGPFSKLTSTALPGTSFLDSSVQAGQIYYYVVTAVNSSNAESVYSNKVSAAIP